MTHVVTQNCYKCERMGCVVVCPVDCFHEGPEFVVIDPEVCIDCAVCVMHCPVDAIYEEKETPTKQRHFVAGNADLARRRPVLATPVVRRLTLGI